ncbi:hypothetical protein [uncultured Coprobacter sp.]|uniref:hypothetical protein n=1 Tax=uncultured Coprobacter sp. TaxID=1720550 RepID=UPI002628A627|nr:hypothetical protein [uncultured Coprobacter sp.]
MTKIIWLTIDNIIVNNALMTARRTVAMNGTTAGLIVDALEVLNIIQTMNDIGEIKGVLLICQEDTTILKAVAMKTK